MTILAFRPRPRPDHRPASAEALRLVERAGDLAAIAEAESTRACAAREAFRRFAESRTGTSRFLTAAEARRRSLLLAEIDDAENRLAEAVLEACETFHAYRAERGRAPVQQKGLRRA